MSSIFISYRRNDNAYATGRIYDRLLKHFDKREIFIDVDSIPYGIDFRVEIRNCLANCQVLLLVIGDYWLESGDHPSRLANLNDYVRIELETALDRHIKIIPLLVGQAPVPREEDLPVGLRAIACLQALRVRIDPDFHRDMDSLILTLERYIPIKKPPTSPRFQFLYRNVALYITVTILSLFFVLTFASQQFGGIALGFSAALLFAICLVLPNSK
jgi:hypothetical protein